MSIENLEKRMVIHKFNHKKYDPNFLSEPNRAAIIAILSKDQDNADHEKAMIQRKKIPNVLKKANFSLDNHISQALG